MQSGHQDTLKKRYAIKFFLNLEKMPQKHMEHFRLLLEHLAWIEHQFLSGIRDSRKAGSLWGMMRGVGTVHTIIREELKMQKICAKFGPRVLRKDQKERRCHDSRDQFRSRSSWCSGDLRWKLDLLLWPRDQETEFPVESCWLSQTQEGQTEQIHPQTFDDSFFWQHWHDLHALGSHWTDSQQGKLCWGFKGVQEEIPSEEASTLQIGSLAFPPEQCTSPQLHPSHRLFDQDGHQDSSSASL